MRGASVLVIQSEQRQAHTPRREPFMRRRGLVEIIFQPSFPVSGILERRSSCDQAGIHRRKDLRQRSQLSQWLDSRKMEWASANLDRCSLENHHDFAPVMEDFERNFEMANLSCIARLLKCGGN